MILLAKPQADSKDFVELVSIDYALKRAGAPIVGVDQARFNTLRSGSKLYIVGHGAPDSVGNKNGVSGYTAGDLVAKLTDPQNGLVKSRAIDIIFTSCNVGMQNVVHTKSFVAMLAKGLSDAGYTNIRIEGSAGPSVKSDVTGDEYTVYNPATEGQASRVESKLKGKLRPQQKLDEWLGTAEGKAASLQRRAEYAASISQLFFGVLTAEVKAGGLALKPKESMATARTGGVSPAIQTIQEQLKAQFKKNIGG